MRKIFLSILSGLILAFSWPETGVFPLIFFALIPLLILEKEISESVEKTSWKVFGYSFISFFIFNIITTYWVWHATFAGAFAAFVINALLMSFAFVLFHKVKNVLGNKRGYFSLIFLWISMEYLHLHWDLAWPWLTLGNVFAVIPEIVQWYEYTGVLGGSLWVLLLNILFFKWWISEGEKMKWILPSVFIVIPILFSFYNGLDIRTLPYITEEIVIVQPNVDPYKDKFNRDAQTQLDDFINLAKEKLTQNTTLLVGPETALQEFIWESKISKTQSISKLQNLQTEFPILNILIGSSTFKYLGENKEENSRRLNKTNEWYNAYNSAIFLGVDSTISIYHKTNFVPGVEKIPYSFLLNLIADFSVDLGGASGSLSKDNTIDNFKYKEVNILPLICYESIFGDMITGKYSNIITIITNDGWWKNTSGYKQHFQYARLRAIEQRRSVVRSANTGISGVISPFGEVLGQTNWEEEIAINITVPLNETITFYNQFGDYIGRIFSFVSVLLLFSTFVKKRTKKTPTS
jgi:apolipoprotein N-acyltransferase